MYLFVFLPPLNIAIERCLNDNANNIDLNPLLAYDEMMLTWV